MIKEYEAVDEVRIVMGNQSTQRIYTPAPFCPLQTSHNITSCHRGGNTVTNHPGYSIVMARVDLDMMKMRKLQAKYKELHHR
jgi:hypothetical protein